MVSEAFRYFLFSFNFSKSKIFENITNITSKITLERETPLSDIYSLSRHIARFFIICNRLERKWTHTKYSIRS